ncbi:hypothetical protein SDC9_120867 [bioreactor metagenome]|uniref:Uncharacterized protein n=1 Tax=bioreactor metagenome TaxID=1076179 RepID=A0A645CAE7_9ZZZZ
MECSLSGGGLSDLGGRGGVVRELGRAGLVVGVHCGARGVPADGKADDAGQQRHHGQDEEGVLQPVLLAEQREHQQPQRRAHGAQRADHAIGARAQLAAER